MEVMIEKEAEDFLEKNGFEVVGRDYVSKEGNLKKVCEEIGFPLVMKVSGGKIIHKVGVGGVKVGIKNYEDALKIFKEFMKISGAEGVLIQEMFSGKEFILGIKKTPEFDHVLGFGEGGSGVEEKKKVSFRVVPLSIKDARQMIGEISLTRKISWNARNKIVKNILKLSRLVDTNPKISELDVNPLTVSKEGDVKVVDARVVLN
jgi:hypothetical protein